MLGKPHWFEIRKYGWGIKPRTWQGWLYIIVLIIPLVAIAFFPAIFCQKQLILSIIWLALISLDAARIMFSIKKDEREHAYEAIAERNSGWFMVAIALLSILYVLYTKHEAVPLFFLVGMLLGGALVKGLSYKYLELG